MIPEPGPINIINISGAVEIRAAHVDEQQFPSIEWENATGTEGSTLHVTGETPPTDS